MTGNRERQMENYPDEDWERLGRLLRQRRPQLDPRYRIRRVFAEENHLTDKTVQEIENAYRKTFSDEMLSTIEVAYRLQAGTLERILKDPGVTEFPHHSGTATLYLDRPQPAIELPPGVSLPDMPPWEREMWSIHGLSAEERGLAVAAVRYLQNPDADETVEQLFLRLLPKVLERLPGLLRQARERGENGTPKAG